jgi:anhydro-N-acetylmuramic acid kinase
MTQPFLRAIGLMSGTSLDGVDAAWIATDGTTVLRTGLATTLLYKDSLQKDLRRLLDLAPTLPADDPFLKDVERRLTEDHALAVGLLGLGADVVGMHGQTILHAPAQRRSWQIGDAAALAARTGIEVVHDFRSADVQAGGQGAPLVPLFHAALAEALPKPLLIVNIGGVANITYLGADGEILACDTGPGNGPLDDFICAHTGQAYDADGALGASGRVDEGRLAWLLADPYFALPAPKSLDRLHFSTLVDQAVAGLSVADGAATLAAFTAAAIAAAPLPAPPLKLLVTGGGRKNQAIMAALAARFAVPVEPVEAVGWDGDALEAQCFGFLAVRSKYGLPLSLPTTTGVPAPQTGGRIATRTAPTDPPLPEG